MHELYRVSRRPYLIAARPPDLAFNFLRTDYGLSTNTLPGPVCCIVLTVPLNAMARRMRVPMVNRDKPDLWKDDVARSVDMYNDWFINFAPKTFRDSRAKATLNVEAALKWTKNLTKLQVGLLKDHPEVLQILRMSTCPPIARDRLIGLARVRPNLVKSMEPVSY